MLHQRTGAMLARADRTPFLSRIVEMSWAMGGALQREGEDRRLVGCGPLKVEPVQTP